MARRRAAAEKGAVPTPPPVVLPTPRTTTDFYLAAVLGALGNMAQEIHRLADVISDRLETPDGMVRLREKGKR